MVKNQSMRIILSVIILLSLASACKLRQMPQSETKNHLQYNWYQSRLSDGRVLQTGISHSADTVAIPQSAIVMLLESDTLLKGNYYSYFRLLLPETYGITSPIPTDMDVQAAFGGEFAETGFFLYVVQKQEEYLLYELKTTPKDGQEESLRVITAF